MKLLSSFKKELILATRSFYFYIELFFAVVLLAVVMFAIPEHSKVIQTEYVYLNIPEQIAIQLEERILGEDIDGKVEEVSLEAGEESFEAKLIETDEDKIYIVDSEEAVEKLADEKQNTGAVIFLGDDNQLHSKFYLQGYESARLKNLISVMMNAEMEKLNESVEAQQVKVLSSEYEPLNDRENALPPLVAFNSSLMGMFIMASYIFLDKKEGVITAYAVTASSVARYLLSKTMVMILVAVVSGLIAIMPIMGFSINYGLLLLLLITSGFFGSMVGFLIASIYKNIAKAFSTVYVLMILMMVPMIAYFLPGWNPVWVNFIPSDPLIKAFKEILMTGGDAVYALLVSAGFLVAGGLLFMMTNFRFKRTLSI